MCFPVLFYQSSLLRDVKIPKFERKFPKNWKKFLTWRFTCVIVNKLSTWRKQRDVPWKLNNVRKTAYANKHQKVKRVFRNSRQRLYILLRARKHSKNDFIQLSWLRYHLLRVWSWLRMNAGGVPNTCKSNEALLTEIRQS